jgi:hypothetical protein
MDLSNLSLSAISVFLGQSIAFGAQQGVELFRDSQAPIGLLAAYALYFVFSSLTVAVTTRELGADAETVTILSSCFSMLATTVVSFSFNIFGSWAIYLINSDPYSKPIYEWAIYVWIAFFFIWCCHQKVRSLFRIVPVA